MRSGRENNFKICVNQFFPCYPRAMVLLTKTTQRSFLTLHNIKHKHTLRQKTGPILYVICKKVIALKENSIQDRVTKTKKLF